MIWDASLGAVADGKIQSAVIVTMFEDQPLYAFCITRPRYQRRGFCRELMIRSLGALSSADHPSAHLFVTEMNEPALALYRELRFE